MPQQRRYRLIDHALPSTTIKRAKSLRNNMTQGLRTCAFHIERLYHPR